MAALGVSAPGRLGVWIQAARLRTLPAALAPITVGTAVAFREGSFEAAVALAAFATAVLLQIGANFANDLYDFARGADGPDRLGPPRVTQGGLVRPATMARATFGVLGLAAVCGAWLAWRGGWPLAATGAAAIVAAYAYTGGPWPLGYHGLGDVLVFGFFGLVAVVGSAYVQTLSLSPQAVVLAVPVGMLATAILAVNNLRDIESDRRAGKRTLAVRLGARGAQIYTVALLLGAHAVVLAAVSLGWIAGGCLLAVLVAPASLVLARELMRRSGRALNPCLGATALHEAGFALTLTVGLLL